jgi:hypothetical protein
LWHLTGCISGQELTLADEHPRPVTFPFEIEVASRELRPLLETRRAGSMLVPAAHSEEPKLGPILTYQLSPDHGSQDQNPFDSFLRRRHDSRVAATEFLVSADLVNRLAGLISSLDSFLNSRDPREVGSPFYFDAELGYPRVKPEVLRASLSLEEPETKDEPGHIPRPLPATLRVSFDVEAITLESPLSFKGKMVAVFLTLGTIAPGATLLLVAGKAGAIVVNALSKPEQTSAARNDYTERYQKDLANGDIRLLQQLLLQQGFDPGPIDGKFGPKTNEALQKFAEMHGFPTGIDAKNLALQHALSVEAAKKIKFP